MTARQTRTERRPDPGHHYDGMAAEAALLKLAQYSAEPGRFPYAPDPAVREAFREGMKLGRQMERRDGGRLVQSPRAVICASHLDGRDPTDAPIPPHGRTGLYFLIAASAVAAAVSACMVLL